MCHVPYLTNKLSSTAHSQKDLKQFNSSCFYNMRKNIFGDLKDTVNMKIVFLPEHNHFFPILGLVSILTRKKTKMQKYHFKIYLGFKMLVERVEVGFVWLQSWRGFVLEVGTLLPEQGNTSPCLNIAAHITTTLLLE